MKKPDRVEVGQWWLFGTRDLFRLAHTLDIGLLTDENAKYLGSGEHPEPSEWMIETLAEHVNAIVDRAAEPTGHARTLARHIVGGGHTRWNDIREGVLLERAVLSLYSILRKLGKW